MIPIQDLKLKYNCQNLVREEVSVWQWWELEERLQDMHLLDEEVLWLCQWKVSNGAHLPSAVSKGQAKSLDARPPPQISLQSDGGGNWVHLGDVKALFLQFPFERKNTHTTKIQWLCIGGYRELISRQKMWCCFYMMHTKSMPIALTRHLPLRQLKNIRRRWKPMVMSVTFRRVSLSGSMHWWDSVEPIVANNRFLKKK